MSGHGDYSDDMGPVLLDDVTTEALLRGEPIASDKELAPVSAFFREMRASASEPPPPPSPALAALLRQGTQPQALGNAAAVPTPRRRGSLLRRWQGRVAVSALGLAVGVTGMVGPARQASSPGRPSASSPVSWRRSRPSTCPTKAGAQPIAEVGGNRRRRPAQEDPPPPCPEAARLGPTVVRRPRAAPAPGRGPA